MMAILRIWRISFSARAMSLMIEGWMPSVGSSRTSTLGLRDQRAGDGELLLLAAGKIAAFAIAHFAQHGKQRIDFVPGAAARRSPRAPVRMFSVHRERSEKSCGPAARKRCRCARVRERGERGDFPIAKFDGAGFGRQNADQRFEQRGFAHAVAAHDGEDFLAADAEAQVVNDLALAVADFEIVDCQA